MNEEHNFGVKGIEVRQKLLFQGFALFIQNGTMETSLADILSYCGIRRGSFYYYFESKDQFVRECFETCYFEPLKKTTDTFTEKSGNSFEDIFDFFCGITRELQRWLNDRFGDRVVCLEDVYPEISFLSRKTNYMDDFAASFSDQETVQLEWVCACLKNMQESGKIRSDVDCAQIAKVMCDCRDGMLMASRREHNMDSMPLYASLGTAVNTFEKLLKP